MFANDEDMEYLNTQFNCRMSRVIHNKAVRQDRKDRLVKLKGGKCEICKKKYPNCVFDFHHITKGAKSYNIGNAISQTSIKEFEEKVVPEAMTCQLICSNCHRVLQHKNNK